MRGLNSFYRSFYGGSFYRHFRRPSEFNHKHFRIQYTLKSPKNIHFYVNVNNGYHPCFIHVYDHGALSNLRAKNPEKMVLDRAFFDFDVSHPEARKIKEKLGSLRSHGTKYQEELQQDLMEKLRFKIQVGKIAKPAIDEAKDFAVKFKETFGTYPALFFSGGKGCHAYTFFRASSFKNINLAISWFAEHIKDSYGYQNMDLSVNKDAMARLSRIPYSKHQLTGFNVVPFTINDSYEDIIHKSLDPRVEKFHREDHSSDFNKHLQKIDLVESHNSQVNNSNLNKRPVFTWKNKKSNQWIDHRAFFKSLLGRPEREYPDKKYVMYHCPFPGHDDKNPSFMVHEKGYYCYGCQKKGNYWNFLRDSHGF
ncbi:MAG: hypothetical protein KKF16_08600 [Euryarchaeota archaeon]|nr:hypothetical protein [Euryarchaeota archaeon]MBV1754732.1 hypothetical protein [Methanobacterium sp.]